jgi:hypothetical protein
MEGTIYRGGGSPNALASKTAPDAMALKTVPWPPRQPLWAGPNTHVGGDPAAPMTNTIIIL